MNVNIASSTGFTWGVGVWGSASWGTTLYENYADFYPRVPLKAASFRIEESSSTVRVGALPLGSGNAPDLGGYALYEILANYSIMEAA